MSHVYSFEEFLAEGKMTVKRKYTDSYPAMTVGDLAPVREKIISFIAEKGQVTVNELKEFISLMNEEIGTKTTYDWVRKNGKYFNRKGLGENQVITLSAVGKKVHTAYKKNEV